MSTDILRIAIIGGGAAGYFSALIAAQLDPAAEVIIFEKTRQPLAKVKISGGGRCNVTHHCFDPKKLSTCYPRGSQPLKQAFYSFQPQDMIDWLQERGVDLKVEKDGRMFPSSNSSSTIISCFQNRAKELGVKVVLEKEILQIQKHEDTFSLMGKEGLICEADKVLLATGGHPKSYALALHLGHKIVPPVPSLFTLNCIDERLNGLSGVSLPEVRLKLDQSDFQSEGPLLFTHWGLSGPAILRLSAWNARFLAERNYSAKLIVDLCPGYSYHQVRECFLANKQTLLSKPIHSTPLFLLPKHVWKKWMDALEISEHKVWAHFSKSDLHACVEAMKQTELIIEGKSAYKEEFVTCGGIPWDEIDAKKMESKICSGLHFAGEVIDTDGITGGFNFQNAWTTGWIAAHAMTSD